MLTGTVVVDLVAAKDLDRMRVRAATLAEVPTGARVKVVVGPLKVEPAVVRVLVLHERRLQIDVQGTAYAVRAWLDALRTHMGEVIV